MLITRPPQRSVVPRRQAGVVLIIALIALVVMTLAALALIRSTDTSNLIAGNMAFQQAATHAGDSGIEAAVTWLSDCNYTNLTCATGTLNSDSPSNGYSANGNSSTRNPATLQSWDAYWTANLTSANTVALSQQSGTGNIIQYVIDRMCSNVGAPTGGGSCTYSPSVSSVSGAAEEAGQIQLNAPSAVYYRVTVRISGPRNSVSYIQAMVSM